MNETTQNNNGKTTKHERLDTGMTQRNILISISVFVVSLGVGITVYLAQTTEKFFWEARASSTIDAVDRLSVQLEDVDFDHWQEPETHNKIEKYAIEVRNSFHDVGAIKIYNTKGILTWTTVHYIQPGHQKPESDGELKSVAFAGHKIGAAGPEVKQELNNNNLIEIWSTIKNSQGQPVAFIEFYFDTRDVDTFIAQLRYTFGGSILITLFIILFLLKRTFRRQDDTIIRQAHELSNIIEQSPIGIITVAKNGTIETRNPAMAKIAGSASADEAIGANIFDSPTYKRNGLDESFRAGLEGSEFETEVAFESPQNLNQKTYRRYHGVPIKDSTGNVLHLLVMVEDITEHKMREQGLDEQAKGLASAVDARTKALEEKIDELERFERLTVDREIRMTELKQQIEKMRIKLESFGVDSDTI